MGITITKVGETKANAPKRQPLHRHDFYYLLLLEKGAGSHTIDFEPHPVADWTLFLMRPGQVHEHELLPGSKGWLIAFQPEFYPVQKQSDQVDRLNRLVQFNHFAIPEQSRDRVLEVVTQLASELKKKEIGFEEVIRSYLNILFTFLYRIPQEIGIPRPSEKRSRLHELQLLIEENLSEVKKVSDYADKMNLTVYQLNNITKTTLGKTGSEFIADQIVLEAKRQLIASDILVNQVAFNLGYLDPAYFIRFFKKQTGTTPGLFREQFFKSAG